MITVASVKIIRLYLRLSDKCSELILYSIVTSFLESSLPNCLVRCTVNEDTRKSIRGLLVRIRCITEGLSISILTIMVFAGVRLS